MYVCVCVYVCVSKCVCDSGIFSLYHHTLPVMTRSKMHSLLSPHVFFIKVIEMVMSLRSSSKNSGLNSACANIE